MSRPTALVLRALGLGDLLTVVPALRGLRRALPAHRLVLAMPAPLGQLALLSGAVDEVLDHRGLDPLLGRSPELAVNLHGRGPQSHAVLRALRPAAMWSYRNDAAGEAAGPHWIAGEHEVARWCRLLDHHGVRADPTDLLLPVPALPSPVAGPLVVHPGAADPVRRWPAERFAEVIRQLDGPVVITGVSGERRLGLRVAALAGLPDDTVLAGRTGVLEMAALIASARLVISGDTGVAHLASAYARPSVVLFGPVGPDRWGPPGTGPHRSLWVGPRAHAGQPVHPALLELTVADVLAAAAALPACPLPADHGKAVGVTHGSP